MRALTRAMVTKRSWEARWDGPETEFELTAILRTPGKSLFNKITLLTKDPDMARVFSNLFEDRKVIKITMEVEE